MPQVESKKKFRRSFSGTDGEELSLETYLWESANILRGHVDASDFKAYIFPLLFYKRISDVYDEEYQKALEESDGDKEYALSDVNHRFQIPKGCHWNNLREKTKNVGTNLQKSFRSIEKSNPDTLFGIFGDANWGNGEKITDELMIDLVEHFSKINLANSQIHQELLGDAYEYLIKRFADLTNKKAGEFYTPRAVVSLLVSILNPNDYESIYDPACGTGGMLLETVSLIRKKKQDSRKLKLYGQESNMNTAAIARINLFLHGVDDFKITRGDTLKEPTYHKGDALTKFDCVIANPPFSLKEWGFEFWKNDPYNRAFAGLPPKGYGDFAWVQHMISSLKENVGRCTVIISSGSMIRSSEKKIRQNLIEKHELLSGIIQLGPNIFYGAGLAPCILIFKKKKSPSEKGNVFMINASKIFHPGRAQNYLKENDINDILQIYENREERPHISRIVPISEIEKQDWKPDVKRYISPKSEEKLKSITQSVSDVTDSILNFQKSEKHLISILKNEGILN